MTDHDWKKHLPEGPESAECWRLYHQNSKTNPYDPAPAPDQAREYLQRTAASLSYDLRPRVALPEPQESALSMPLGQALSARRTHRRLSNAALDLNELGTMLRASYGVNRAPDESVRQGRSCPSPGYSYPLELYLHATRVDGLPAGLYHFHPERMDLAQLQQGDFSHQFAPALLQAELATTAPVTLFFTAVFGRSVAKYGERGYRLVHLEAGHAAQNLCLAATALGLAATLISAFQDRLTDELLGLDGEQQSTLYLASLGRTL